MSEEKTMGIEKTGQFRGLRKATTAANMRGAVDFTNANAFNLYEKGHAILKVLSVPNFMTAWANKTGNAQLVTDFCKIIEQEFKGLDGLDDMSADSMDITDGISTLNVLGKVNYATNQEITMRYTEKAGSTISRFCETYLRGIRDPRTLVKHYNGCLNLAGHSTGEFDNAYNCNNHTIDIPSLKSCQPGFENEIFTFLYIVMDNTWLQPERAYLLCNSQITKAPMGQLHNAEKGNIELQEVDLTFNTFVVTNANVNAAAAKYINTIKQNYNLISNDFKYSAQTKLYAAAGLTDTDDDISLSDNDVVTTLNKKA